MAKNPFIADIHSPESVTPYSITDYDTTRKLVMNRVKDSVMRRFPLANDRYTLSVSEVDYPSSFKSFTKADQKKAILGGQSLTIPLKGKWNLIDNATGNVINSTKKTTLINVPYLTERGTYIRNGHEESIQTQMRLIPGVYTRIKDNGELEAHVNVKQGTGRMFKVLMDPGSGVFFVQSGTRKVKLYPILRSFGVTDDQLKEQWGKDILASNKSMSIGGTTKRGLKGFIKKEASEESLLTDDEIRILKEKFNRMEVDPESTLNTLGKSFTNITPETLVLTTKKLMNVSSGISPQDSRDSLSYQRFYDAPDLFAEHILKDHGRVGRTLLWKATNKGNLDFIGSGILNKYNDAIFNQSKLAQTIEEVNPADVYQRNTRVTRMGEGGIGDLRAAPKSARNVQSTYKGFIDPAQSPESLRVGLDNQLVGSVRKGSDGLLYTPLYNPHTLKTEYVNSSIAAKSKIAMAGTYDDDDKFIPVLVGEDVEYVRPGEIDYIIPSGDSNFATTSNLVPLKSHIKAGRLLMAGKHSTQALSLVNREAPLVQTATPENPSESFEDKMGRFVGSMRADKSGKVLKVTKDILKVRYDDGKTVEYDLYNNFPFNRKTYIRNEVSIPAGKRFKAGDALVTSNYTDKEGTSALGTNLRIAYMPYKGENYKDAVVISESAAKKLTSEHMYKSKLPKMDGLIIDKKRYMAMYPSNFNREQYNKLDDDGIIKPGTVVHKGDPLTLALSENIPSPSSLGRKTFRDQVVTWDHDYPGVVTDTSIGKKGVTVYTRANIPMQEGDKLAGRYGNKGVVAAIIPDNLMVKDSQGNPIEIIMNSTGIISRTNPAQYFEAQLGKIASKTGKKYKLPGFSEGDTVDYVRKELKKNKLSDVETLFDPKTNKDIPEVATGVTYIYKLHHTSESKGGSRSTGIYTAEDQPILGGPGGGKKLGGLVLSALAAHDAIHVLKDSKIIRGQKNDDYWRDYKAGKTPTQPGVPFIYNKFMESLKGAGINVHRDKDEVNIYAMTSSDVEDITRKGGEVKTADTFDNKTYQPIEGGLFSQNIFGPDGNVWGYIQLDESIPNPVMADTIKSILNLRDKDYRDIIAGRQETVSGFTGGSGLKKELEKINLDAELNKAKELIKTSGKTGRDKAIKRYRYLHAMKEHGTSPKDFMFEKIPVLPSKYRPISTVDNMVMVSDANYLYKNLLEARDDLREASGELPDSMLHDQKERIYNAFEAVVGLAAPDSKKLQEKKVGGFFKWMFGKSSPKFGAIQKKVIGGTLDISGRSVVTPNSSLKLDEIGLPESQAWEIYTPFTIRKLVDKGMAPTMATKYVSEKKDVARNAMQDVMNERPLIITRAPALHKFSLLAVKPKLIKGNTLQVSPIIASPLNLDHDGNCCDFDEKIFMFLSKSAIDILASEDYNGIIPLTKEEDMLTEEIKVWFTGEKENLIPICCKIGEFPKVGVPTKDKNDADVYTLPEGIFISSYDKEKGPCLKQVTKFTVEQDCPSVRVVYNNGMDVIVSSNESLCVFNRELGDINKEAPEEAIGKYSPVLRKLPAPFGNFGDKNLGWWIGMFLSDGWVTDKIVGLAKLEDIKRDKFVEIARSQICDNFVVNTYEGKKGKDKLGNSKKIHLYGKDLAQKIIGWNLKPAEGEGRSSLRKKIPMWMISQGSEDFLWGLISGLIDGDGSLTINKAFKNPRYGARIATSSQDMVEALKLLSHRLGLRYSVTTTPPRGHSNTAYTFFFSTIDMFDNLDNLLLTGERETGILQSWKDNPPNRKTERDVVPISEEEEKIFESILGASHYIVISSRNKGAVGRSILKDALVNIKNIQELDNIKHRVLDIETLWASVKTVEDAGNREVFDFEVEDTKVFSIGCGLVVWDTFSYYVPASKEAVKEAYDKMMPSKNLLSARWFKSHFLPEEEYILGLYLATRKKAGPPKAAFKTMDEAIAAYRKGKIDIDDNISITGKSNI